MEFPAKSYAVKTVRTCQGVVPAQVRRGVEMVNYLVPFKADLIAALLLVASTSAYGAPFQPGVKGRSAKEVCHSSSQACQQWTSLARKCEDNMRQRDAGYMGPQKPYCTQAETLRERSTGIKSSSAPGAYDF